MEPIRLARLTAVLIRGPGQPDGDTGDVLELLACLTADASLSVAAWCDAREYCSATRQRGGKQVWEGRLVWADVGWTLITAGAEDDPAWDLDVRKARPGECLTLRRPGVEEEQFRIVNVSGPEP